MSQFDPIFEALPATVPIFPLPGVLLLPRGMLPLNIFEPRYLNMVQDVLSRDRMIAMVQPCEHSSDGCQPKVYPMACAGRITAFEETDDGRFLISLKGVSRLKIAEEIASTRGYRVVRAEWDEFREDLSPPPEETVDRKALFNGLKPYFASQGIEASWQALCDTPDERLINSLAMICPFSGPEKQALLEAPNLAERAKVLTALIEMAVLDTDGSDGEKTRQ